MGEILITAEGTVHASAEQVYHFIANYRDHHHRFLPPAFSHFQVEQGGMGEGTIIRFRVKAGGRSYDYHQKVTEPVPGRVLQEAGLQSGEVTTFTVIPQEEASRVHIETRSPDAGGLRGSIERLLAPLLLKPLYADELKRLDQYAREHAVEPATSLGA